MLLVFCLFFVFHETSVNKACICVLGKRKCRKKTFYVSLVSLCYRTSYKWGNNGSVVLFCFALGSFFCLFFVFFLCHPAYFGTCPLDQVSLKLSSTCFWLSSPSIKGCTASRGEIMFCFAEQI